MTARMNPYAHGALTQPLIDFATSSAAAGGLEHSLLDLVKIRASQINRCAICLHMHSSDARKAGETEMRVIMLDAWRESPLYSARERAALGWTDALTKLSQGHTHDAAWDALAEHFSEEERVKLTLLINVINGWNRIAVGFGLYTDAATIRASAKAVAA